jgi:hypothetical protein
LRKPLRKSSFSEALNLIEEKIRSQQAAEQNQQTASTATDKTTETNWAGALLNRLNLNKKPAQHLPPLNLQKAAKENLSNKADTIKDPVLLQAWINQLPKDTNQRIGTLLSNLQPLNQLNLKPMLRLQLLEIYRSAVMDLLFTRDISAVKRDLYVTTENLKAIRTVSELITKLAEGYKQIVSYYYDRGETPEHKVMLLSLNRATEHLSLQILHAYHYYRSAPTGAWAQLHEFYLYQEQAQTLSETVTLKEHYQSPCFFDLYGQIILTTLADPYSLAKFDVFRLFRLMEQFTDKIEISLLSEKQINITSNFLLTGHFCIDCTQDVIPQPMVKTPVNIRAARTTRLLNTQPALLAIENIFKNAKNKHHASPDTELRLLKKIIPQLNTTHERRFHRLTTARHRSVQIAHGINAIHLSLTQKLTHALEWQLVNQSSGGVMAKRNSEGCYHLNIGDFVGIFEADYAVKLATIKWLHIDIEGESHIGLELIDGKPVPVYCTPDGEAEQHPALLLPANDPQSPSNMITEKGLYSPKRKLRIKNDGDPYLIIVSGMIDSTLDYEQFNYTIKL